MEQSFSERLKRYRKEKNMTQQDLADALGVSNKSVSRWESEGGYPDVPLLVPLARALGVTVDDLLDGERPVRTLTRTDWQSLLSFGFALGGGVLFYLLDLFMPSLVCYLAYLGCMAYGVYLQKYYTYQSRWFWLANGVMDLSVNLTLLLRLAALLFAARVGTVVTVENQYEPGVRLMVWLFGHKALIVVVLAVLALVLTAATQYLVLRWSGAKGEKLSHIRLRLAWPRWRQLPAALAPVFACLFWLWYQQEDLPVEAWQRQEMVFLRVLLVLGALAVLPLLKKGWRRWILPAWGITALCWFMTGLRVYRLAWSPVTQRIIPYRNGLGGVYVPLGQWSWGMAALALVLTAAWLLLCSLRLEHRADEAEEQPSD